MLSKRVKFQSTLACAVLAVFFMLTGCAVTTEVTALQPAEVSGAASLKSIGVVPFENKSRYKVSLDSKIEARLTNYQLDLGENYFHVVDRTSLQNIMKEQKFHVSGFVNSQNTVKLGKLLGAEALVSGTLTTADTEDRYYREERTRKVNCDSKGKNCSQQEYTVSCTARTAILGAQIRLTDIEQGKLITAQSYNKDQVWHVCDDASQQERANFPATAQALELLADDLANDFVYPLVPRYQTFQVTLYKKPELKLEAADEKRFSAGLDFIKANRLDRAEEIYAHLMHTTQGQSFAITYNYAVVIEARKDLKQALKLYEAADKVALKPEKNINEALARVRQSIANENEVNKQSNRRFK